jgi:preprotein translocase subunit SecG
MNVFISILILIASLLLVLIVLVQNSKGGGLAAGFSSSNQVLGVRKTTDFLEKATWGLAGFLIVACIAITAFIPRGKTTQASEVLENTSLPTNTGAPDFGTAQPFESEQAPAQQQPLEGIPTN